MATAASAAPITPGEDPGEEQAPIMRLEDAFTSPRWIVALEGAADNLEEAYGTRPRGGTRSLAPRHERHTAREHGTHNATDREHSRHAGTDRERGRHADIEREQGRHADTDGEHGWHADTDGEHGWHADTDWPGGHAAADWSGRHADTAWPGRHANWPGRHADADWPGRHARRYHAHEALTSAGERDKDRRDRKVKLHRAKPRHATVHLSHRHATRWLKQAGLRWTSSGGCANRRVRHCTSLDKVRTSTVQRMVKLKKRSGCPIIVTGGTETGHAPGRYSHGSGHKLDIGHNKCIDRYIEKTADRAGVRGDGARLYRSPSGTVYADEGDHWDILFR